MARLAPQPTEDVITPDRKTVERARADKRHGKAASTQAGNFVKEEIDHIREGKHGAGNTKQAVAIGLSKARRAGVAVKPPAAGKASAATRKKAERDIQAGTSTRSQATSRALKKESSAAVSKPALSRQGRSAASEHSSRERSAAAKRGAATKGVSGRSAAAKKAARTRAARAR